MAQGVDAHQTMAAGGRVDFASAFKGSIRPVRKSVFYHGGLLLTTVAMVLLPVVYLAIVAGMGWGVFLYAIHGASLFKNAHGLGSTKLAVFAYLGPLAVGVIGLVFMIKPIFAPRGSRPEPITLSPSEEPMLFGFVEVLCRLMGAPVPRRIDVTCDVNAAAGFRRGFLSFLGNDLVLTIGLPLVAGLTARQLAGVLAHELGHFAQGTGMRATYLIDRIDRWFARVVYERDGWDEQLEEWAQDSGHWAVTLVVQLSRLFVGLSRLVLRLLMFLGHATSCFMRRQQEYDADRYEARVAGSESFAPTFRRIAELSLSMQQAHNSARERWNARELPDDLPALAMITDHSMPGEIRSKLFDSILKEKAGLFDSHPSTRSRIRSVERKPDPGVFHIEQPARVLFKDFAGACKRTTYLVYRSMLGDSALKATFVPVGGIVEKRQEREAVHGAFTRVFAGGATSLRPIVLPEPTLTQPTDSRAAGAAAKAARQRLAPLLATIASAAKDLNQADDALADAGCATAILDGGLRLIATRYHLPAATRDAIAARVREAEAARDRALAVVEPFNADTLARLQASLSILLVPGAEKKIDKLNEKRSRLKALAAANHAVGAVMKDAHTLRQAAANIEAVFKSVITERDRQPVAAAAKKWTREAVTLIERLHAGLDTTAFPFAKDELTVTIAGAILESWPDVESSKEVYAVAQAMVGGVVTIYYRVLAELAALAEEAEDAIGLKPLESTPPPSLRNPRIHPPIQHIDREIEQHEHR